MIHSFIPIIIGTLTHSLRIYELTINWAAPLGAKYW